MTANRPILVQCLYRHVGQSEIPCCFIVFVISTINVVDVYIVLNEIIVITIGIWKYIKVQDGRQNIEILLYVFKMASIDFCSSILNLTNAICTYL